MKQQQQQQQQHADSLSYLDLLGPKIQTQVLQKQDLPSNDDTLARWKVFGKSCVCDADDAGKSNNNNNAINNIKGWQQNSQYYQVHEI